jgi:hypothetical protein
VYVASGGLDTDEDFSVLKGDDVCRPRFSEKLPMQKRHSSVGNQPDEKLAQVAQISWLSLSQSQAMPHSFRCEGSKVSDLDADFTLQIAHRNFGH